MPVIDITKDVETRTLTITAEFAAPVERVWALYADPRQLERVWGPPTHPATFVDHELTTGSRSTYYMTSPEGEKFAGWWRITAVEEPHRFSFEDGFAHDDFTANADLPVAHNDYVFEDHDGGTRATFTTVFDSAEDLQKVLDMGMEEGSRQAINQIDEFLATNP
ncbi:conserved hypothetical protein [Nostocoides japonicum T1-X7]|uniref:Activator of Hsp90 ATPase homologue 1/2-like C-terminal domain-containing protein n=1 Tax=Nostocoides japonicum T1-X7 TaxID=1194083 RepID=A0A077LV53_9MICO|nr:SRPBCC domain-containing protein [Tetrasphaera japonica]CCH76627.1 conserved hypothetical protein [Tetrasphaera japonica T1-X7]